MLKKILLMTLLLNSLAAEARIISIWRFDIIWGEPDLAPGIIYNPMKVINTQNGGDDDEMLNQFLALEKAEQKVILSTLIKEKEKMILNTQIDDQSNLGIYHSSSGSGGFLANCATLDVNSEDYKSTLGILHTSSGSGGPHIFCPTSDVNSGVLLGLEK